MAGTGLDRSIPYRSDSSLLRHYPRNEGANQWPIRSGSRIRCHCPRMAMCRYPHRSLCAGPWTHRIHDDPPDPNGGVSDREDSGRGIIAHCESGKPDRGATSSYSSACPSCRHAHVPCPAWTQICFCQRWDDRNILGTISDSWSGRRQIYTEYLCPETLKYALSRFRVKSSVGFKVKVVDSMS